MNIGSVGSISSLLLNSLAKPRGDAPTDMSHALPVRANPAGPMTILPISNATPLSFESILQLQSLDEPEQATIEPPSATEIFLEEARKDPIERMREQIMEELGISEADLAAMSPEERRATEDKIREMIEEKLRQANGGDDAPAQSNGEMLEQLA
jgi:hypothetical protein